MNVEFHYILTILNNYFDQLYWHSISKRVHVIAVWRIQEFLITIQYANEILAHDLVERVVIGWKICLIWDLVGFHFRVPELYANLVLAHDLIEIVLIGWHSAQFRMLQDFTSWCEGCTRALWHIVLFVLRLECGCKVP